MKRTSERPLPSGRVNACQVISLTVLLFLTGSITLYLNTDTFTTFTGIFTFFWYNFVYTPLKKITAFAIIPGSLVGSLPPYTGWLAGGGDVFSPIIILISTYFFIWQIPHFWLLLLIYGEEYSTAGYPSLSQTFSQMQLKRITFVWIIAVSAFGMILAFSGIAHYVLTILLICIASVIIVFSAAGFIKAEINRKNVMKVFIQLNTYTLLIIILLSTDKLMKIIR